MSNAAPAAAPAVPAARPVQTFAAAAGQNAMSFLSALSLPEKIAGAGAVVALIGFFNEVQLNTAFWSLVVEMRISIVFPFLMQSLSRVRTLKVILLAGSAALLLIAIPLKARSNHRGH